MDGMDGMDGWMFFKIIVPRLHVPAGAFFCEKRQFLKKVYFLENRKTDLYEKILFCSKNHNRRSGIRFCVHPISVFSELVGNPTSYDQNTFYMKFDYFFLGSYLILHHPISSYLIISYLFIR